MRHFSLAILFVASFARADAGLDQLRASFAPLLSTYEQILDRAASLAPAKFPLGEPVKAEVCKEMQKAIAARSHIDPFHVAFSNGSTDFFLCGGENNIYSNYVAKTSGKTAFGLPYTEALQWKYPAMSGNDIVVSTLIDANLDIVAVQSVETRPNGEVFAYDVRELDAAGNFYMNGFIARLKDEKHKVTGPNYISRYAAADGSIPWLLLRNRVTDEHDSSRSFTVSILGRSDRKDWQRYDVLPTHGWNGGFFDYGGKLYVAPNYFTDLFIVEHNGKEVCSIGTVKSGPGDGNGNYKSYPEDANLRTYCSNY